LPWGVNFGDGIPRHPTQLYEVLFALTLGVFLWRRSKQPHTEGDLFRLFMVGYFSFRLESAIFSSRMMRASSPD